MRTWWLKYYQGGRPVRGSTGTNKETVPRRMLRMREGDVERGIPIVPQTGKITFDDAADDLLNDYKANGKRTHDDTERRIGLHPKPVFKGKRLISISTADVRAYALVRQTTGAANGTINRELSALKRMFTLAVLAKTLHAKPHISILREDNVRRGFFERTQFESVCEHFPVPLRAIVTLAYLTGWRKSEIFSLEWRQVDWAGRVVRFDPGTTKNREGQSFSFTAALEILLKDQHAEHERLKKTGRIVPLVFHRDGKRVHDLRGALEAARKAAGCPGHILHDFRRTAVRNLERAGVPRSAAMAMVGHKTEAISRRYAIVDAGVLRDAAAKIDSANPVTGTTTGAITPNAHSPAKAHSA